MKVKICGSAMVVESSIKFDDIKAIEKYCPDALILYKGEGAEREQEFRICTGPGSINKYGISFEGKSRDGNGFATFTVPLPSNCNDVKSYVSDTYGASLLKLSKLEREVPGVIEGLAAQRDAIESAIEVS